MSQFSMGTASEFSLSVKEYDISTLTADITTPSGRSEPCRLKKLPNGHLGMYTCNTNYCTQGVMYTNNTNYCTQGVMYAYDVILWQHSRSYAH